MNNYDWDILRILKSEPFINQRNIAEISGYSLGTVNLSLKKMMQEGYLNQSFQLTDQAYAELEKKTPQRAIILAAGYGMRMVPINMETPKAFLEVRGEVLIERQIRQLHEAGIREIYIVVGFMKEKFEYLIDEYGVELVVNEEYASKNNLYSLKLVEQHMDNAYIIPCDIWTAQNPFRKEELYSWYMVSDLTDDESDVRVNRKRELVKASGIQEGNAMIGIAYLLRDQAEAVRKQMDRICAAPKAADYFWEEALYEKDRMIVPARVVQSTDVVEINTYEQLREFDSCSSQLKTDAIEVITKVLGVREEDVVDITVLKKGMTNRSFLFSCKGRKYIMRIPGEGTDKLINRRQEGAVYRMISGLNLCDDPVYFNSDNGYKITKYIENVRCCDPEKEEDLVVCMSKLRKFHEMGLQVDHEFDIYGMIDFYESLWEGMPSVYKDYESTKSHIFELKKYIDIYAAPKVLTHIDAVPDNFLFDSNVDGELSIQLTDWEYAGMQDPHVDIAMFCIYSLYNQHQIDRLISIYFKGNCTKEIKIKIYCYIAACGLLWSNWCEYKRNLGVEFGEYSLRQYRYAKDYYKIVMKELAEEN